MLTQEMRNDYIEKVKDEIEHMKNDDRNQLGKEDISFTKSKTELNQERNDKLQ